MGLKERQERIERKQAELRKKLSEAPPMSMGDKLRVVAVLAVVVLFVSWLVGPDEQADDSVVETRSPAVVVAAEELEPAVVATAIAEPDLESIEDLGVTVGEVLDALVMLVEGEVLDKLPEMITESDNDYWYLDIQSEEANTDLVLYGVVDHDDSNQKSRLLTKIHYLQSVSLEDPLAVMKGLAILGAVGKAAVSEWSDPMGDVDRWLKSGQDKTTLFRFHGSKLRDVSFRNIQLTGYGAVEMVIEPH